MQESAADLAMIQETGVEAGAATQEVEQAARSCGWKVRCTPCAETAAGGRSAGVAVAARNHLGMAKTAGEGEPDRTGGRLAVATVNAVCPGGIAVASIYCFTSVGLRHKSNLDLLHEVAGTLNALTVPGIISGDWNDDPAALRESGWLKLVGGTVVAPLHTTCNDRTIDLFVVPAGCSMQSTK